MTLAIFSAIVLYQQRKPGPHRVFMPYVIAVLMCVEAFMTLLLGFVASPFEALPRPPADGVGLNPLLYDEGMRIHPPMLLAGLMSWTIPFAFAVAALVSGDLSAEWIRATRRYALIAWGILGVGNLLGAWWAYHVLGWGGYWGWDPVENSAIMPWLAMSDAAGPTPLNVSAPGFAPTRAVSDGRSMCSAGSGADGGRVVADAAGDSSFRQPPA